MGHPRVHKDVWKQMLASQRMVQEPCRKTGNGVTRQVHRHGPDSPSIRGLYERYYEPYRYTWLAGSGSVLAVCLAVLGFLTGVRGNDGPRRYELGGRITWSGQPVPAGQILFTPDAAKGNSGPGGMAKIKEGRYVTLPGLGIIGGPHKSADRRLRRGGTGGRGRRRLAFRESVVRVPRTGSGLAPRPRRTRFRDSDGSSTTLPR